MKQVQRTEAKHTMLNHELHGALIAVTRTSGGYVPIENLCFQTDLCGDDVCEELCAKLIFIVCDIMRVIDKT